MSMSSRFAVAVHILTLMAWSDDEPLKSDQVAESVNTNPVVIRRMLAELSEANLVISQTGANGGSRLSRKPKEITLQDVYHAVECPGVFSLHKQPASRQCPVGMNIEAVLGSVFAETNSAVEHVLATIKDVMSRIKPGNGKGHRPARARNLDARMISDRTQSVGKRMRSGTIAKET